MNSSGKKKILFYGNCQLGVISQYFLKDPALNELFEVIKCDESCAPMDIWRGDQSNFAVWTKENRPIQKDYFHIIHEKLKQADLFVFQSTERDSIKELTTEFLCGISSGKNICVQNIRLFIYCNDVSALRPYLEYAQTKVKNPENAKELADFLRNSEDSELVNILERDYPISSNYERYRNENAQRAEEESRTYPVCVNMEGFIKENYRTKVLALQHNHMSRQYFVGLLGNVLDILGVRDLDINQEQFVVPGEGRLIVWPLEFKFFRNYFLDLDFPEVVKRHPLENLIQDLFLKN